MMRIGGWTGSWATVTALVAGCSSASPPPAEAPLAAGDVARGTRWLSLTPEVAAFDVIGPTCATWEILQRQSTGEGAVAYRALGRNVDGGAVARRFRDVAAQQGVEVRVTDVALAAEQSSAIASFTRDELVFTRRVPQEQLEAEAQALFAGTEVPALVASLGGPRALHRVSLLKDETGKRRLEVQLRGAGLDADDAALARWASARGLTDRGDHVWTGASGGDTVTLQASVVVRNERRSVSLTVATTGMKEDVCR